MTERRTDAEMQKYELVKALRAAIRLKHSINADRELNEVLPDAEDAFDVAWHKGQLKGGTVDITAIVKKVVSP
jgi:hypothetical protein